MKNRFHLIRNKSSFKTTHTIFLNGESKLYLGLHQKKQEQQVKGGDSSPLICSVFMRLHLQYCLVLGPPTSEGHRSAGVNPEQGNIDYQRAREPLLQRPAETVGIV